MKLLLHVCCAPCSSEVIERLSKDYDVTGFFFNPNIHPDEEYLLRLHESRRFLTKMGLDMVEADYDPGVWHEQVKGFEEELEGGGRCEICFMHRLRTTAKTAKKLGFGAFTTTLTISPHKDSTVINDIGKKIAEEEEVSFVSEDFKKRDGFKKSIAHSIKHGLRRQSYCGCIYSKRERGL